MKIVINEEGYLHISPESSLEAYALHKWVEENHKDFSLKMIISWDFGGNSKLVQKLDENKES